jgi:hypothetical protein
VVSNWTGDFNQEWAISLQENNTFCVGPRNAYWRVLAVDKTSSIIIADYTMGDSHQWILTII